MALHPWFERQFAFELPLWMAPNIVERLRGDRFRGLRARLVTFFVAEHDDHHPARITELLRSAGPG